MPKEVDLYDGHYLHLATRAQVEVRAETYGDDLGQSGWITLAEARDFFRLLDVRTGRTVLDVGCGSGGITCQMARDTGATCIGIDINAHGIDAANTTAAQQRLSSLAAFQVVDAADHLPFPDESFDAVFCNDAILHLPGRLSVLREWHRVVRPGGRVLFTDPAVVTGQLTNEEIRVRSSIGFFLFTPLGENERLLDASGFLVREVRDVTGGAASVSQRWMDARSKRRDALVSLEGADGFEGLQRFLAAVHTLASDRRLSRWMYLAAKLP